MPNKMLIDASHPEETRVVVVRGNRIEEFDFESQDKKQLKGNIYLARVTRVEPSLQAAFVEYGGNRHGFLAFSEIHPDYYQIPVADRQALLHAEEQDAEDEENDANGDADDRPEHGRGRRDRRRGRNRGHGGDSHLEAEGENGEETNGEETASTDQREEASASSDAPDLDDGESSGNDDADDSEARVEASIDDETNTTIAAAADAHVISEEVEEGASENDHDNGPTENGHHNGSVEEVSHSNGDEHEVEVVGAGDALDEVRSRRKPLRRHYKIQEVIKRRQILLVQVVKEERGNKGAALTTYLSLAGRYSVLMPNTPRGGGISRKITNPQDRKRLKEVVAELDVPKGMGVILRTAGESRTKAEIKRDYEYLMRLWENVRNLTLQSTAPALVYEEGSLIKRSVRDLYNKDIDQILVAGEEGYREAKDFMRMLMPSHAKVVQPYREATPIFARNGIEAQLDKMLQPQVTLKSGGYLIINQTEALVSIDVNSGRSTREHSIEETALQTNLEAAEEIARQLRLRDLAGLIVIDFIDMEENRNNRAVEKKLKECLKNDRARIQVGRISHFGLLEMSRQRIRSSVLESTTKPCPHCGGTGHVRSDSSVALMVVRAVEEFLLKDSRNHIIVRTTPTTALYVLNHKRSTLVDLERRFGVNITIEADDSLGTQHYAIARGALAEKPEGFVESRPQAYIEAEEADAEVEEEDIQEDQAEAHDLDRKESEGQRKRRRRRRRRGGRDRDQESIAAQSGHDDSEESEASSEAEATQGVSDHDTAGDESDSDVTETSKPDVGELAATDQAGEGSSAKKRRRGKRGGKRNRREGDEAVNAEAHASDEEETATEAVSEVAEETASSETMEPSVVSEEAAEEALAEKPKRRRSVKARKTEDNSATEAGKAAETQAEPAEAGPDLADASSVATPEAEPEKKKRAARKITANGAAADAAEPSAVDAQDAAEEAASNVAAPAADDPAPEPVEDKPKRVGWWQRKGFF